MRTNKRGGARPNSGPEAYQPTESDRGMVTVMAAAGIPQDRIGRCIGTGISPDSLARHFRHELDVGKDKIDGICAQGLVKLMQEGNLGALCFWAKTRMGWRETQKLEVSGSLSIIDAILDAGSDPER